MLGTVRDCFLASFYSELIESDGGMPAHGARVVPRPKIRHLLYEVCEGTWREAAEVVELVRD